MFAHAKAALIVAGLMLGTLTLMGARSNVPVAPAEHPAVAGESRPVLVEAFVVEVVLPGLAKLGVSPIGQEPHAVSVADILKCLDSGDAQVIAGAKATAGNDGGTEVRATEMTYIRREAGGPQQTVSYQSRDTGRQFSASLKPMPPGASAVAVQFSFSHTMFREKEQPADTPPSVATWQWSGSAILAPGAPKIVAATQDADSAVFLLLTAHVAPK